MADEPQGDARPIKTLVTSRDGAVLFAEIAAPPMNLLGPELVRDLVLLIQTAEADDSLRVVVFKSGDPDYFISHVDLTRVPEYRAEAAVLTGEASIASLFRHISTSRLVTIAQIEGRVRGAGSEFVRPATCASPRERPRSSRSSNPRSVRSQRNAWSRRRCSEAFRPETPSYTSGAWSPNWMESGP